MHYYQGLGSCRFPKGCDEADFETGATSMLKKVFKKLEDVE